MSFDELFYFHVKYGYDDGTWKERDEYGFVPANSFEDALAHLREYYGSDIMSVTLESIGDFGLLAVGNKELVDTMKREFIKYHYE